MIFIPFHDPTKSIEYVQVNSFKFGEKFPL